MFTLLFHIVFSILSLFVYSMHAIEPWSLAYFVAFNAPDMAGKDAQVAYTVTKEHLAPFTQLIFSWNAYRPKKGYYSFWIQGQDSKTGAWGSRHKMMVWGSRVQRSFISKSATLADHIHVRFETHPGKKCSGFRISIRAHDGADLGLIRSITANCADFTKFVSEAESSFTHLSTIRVRGVPRRSQFVLQHPEKHRLCSPTSCAMLVESLIKQRCDPNAFAYNVYDNGLDAYGSWPFNTAHAFECSKGAYWYQVVRYNSFNTLYEQLKRGFPVVVSVRGGIEGAPKVYESGHLLIVVGFNARTQKVVCHDPAGKRDHATVRSYSLRSFLKAWEASRRLAYHAEPCF